MASSPAIVAVSSFMGRPDRLLDGFEAKRRGAGADGDARLGDPVAVGLDRRCHVHQQEVHLPIAHLLEVEARARQVAGMRMAVSSSPGCSTVIRVMSVPGPMK